VIGCEEARMHRKTLTFSRKVDVAMDLIAKRHPKLERALVVWLWVWC
jgi:hypothetical protein